MNNTAANIMDSIYLIPMVLDHMDNPTDVTRKFMEDYEIDINEMRGIRHLLEYHQSMIRNNFNPDYPLLRKGLKEYWEQYLHSVFLDLGIVYQKGKWLLDYGAGSGQASEEFKKRNPDSHRLTIDREDADLNIDFEEDRDWYKDFLSNFDYVLVSELLHCKTRETQQYIIDTSHDMLKSVGYLIIIENDDYAMSYRINKIKNSFAYNVITDSDIDKLVTGRFLLLRNFKIQRHRIYLYGKI